MSRVIVNLEPELAEKLRRAAEREGVSPSRWVAQLIGDKLNAERLDAQWSEEVGKLAGSWPDAPDAGALRAEMLGWLKVSESAFGFWDNEEDAVWDEVEVR